MDYKVKQWIRRHHALTNIVFAVLGLALFILGMNLLKNEQYIPIFLYEVGLALITNAILF